MKRRYLSSKLMPALAATALLLPTLGLAELASAIEVQASWFTGEGRVTVIHHARIEKIGLELDEVARQKASKFIGKLGPCSKRITFLYPQDASRERSYFFMADKMIVLAPNKERQGIRYSFSPAKYPAVAQLLAEVGSSKTCGDDA